MRTEFIKILADDLEKDLDNFKLLWAKEIPTLNNKKLVKVTQTKNEAKEKNLTSKNYTLSKKQNNY